MRVLPIVALALAVAVTAGAQERFTLGLEELPISAAPEVETPEDEAVPDSKRLELHLVDGSGAEPLVFRGALVPGSAAEYRLALWTDPMGRLYYGLAAEEAMLGREGLVAGGRMSGLGLATGALGDGGTSSLGLVMRNKWSELTFSDKLQAGIEASFVAALLYYMAEYAD